MMLCSNENSIVGFISCSSGGGGGCGCCNRRRRVNRCWISSVQRHAMLIWITWFLLPPTSGRGSESDAGCNVITIFGLKTADCNKRSSKTIPQTMDNDLQVLRFDENRLTYLDTDEFRSYPNLQEIYLARNRIEDISSGAFNGLFILRILDLEGNQLTSVPSSSFAAISSLRMISLKSNPIRKLDAGALTSLKNIEEINFENCWLDTVDHRAFYGLNKLVEINLVNNELRVLLPSMETSLSSTLTILRLYRNPWTCNCQLRWLRRLISYSASINWDFASNTPACAAPELIKGVAWKHLTPDQFACPSRIIANANSTSVRVREGENATLQCVAVGDPEPTVAWSRDSVRVHRDLIKEKRSLSAETAERQVVSVVALRQVRLDQSGDYKCSADNSAGRSEVTFKLWVESRPASSISNEPDRVRERETILGVLVGIIGLVSLIVLCLVCRLKRRNQLKHAYKLNEYVKDPCSMEPDAKDRFDEEDEGQEDSYYEEESSFNFPNGTGKPRTDSTLQSLLNSSRNRDGHGCVSSSDTRESRLTGGKEVSNPVVSDSKVGDDDFQRESNRHRQRDYDYDGDVRESGSEEDDRDEKMLKTTPDLLSDADNLPIQQQQQQHPKQQPQKSHHQFDHPNHPTRAPVDDVEDQYRNQHHQPSRSLRTVSFNTNVQSAEDERPQPKYPYDISSSTETLVIGDSVAPNRSTANNNNAPSLFSDPRRDLSPNSPRDIIDDLWSGSKKRDHFANNVHLSLNDFSAIFNSDFHGNDDRKRVGNSNARPNYQQHNRAGSATRAENGPRKCVSHRRLPAIPLDPLVFQRGMKFVPQSPLGNAPSGTYDTRRHPFPVADRNGGYNQRNQNLSGNGRYGTMTLGRNSTRGRQMSDRTTVVRDIENRNVEPYSVTLISDILTSPFGPAPSGLTQTDPTLSSGRSGAPKRHQPPNLLDDDESGTVL